MLDSIVESVSKLNPIYVSLGGFTVACTSLAFTFRESKNRKKSDQLKAYDKAYKIAYDLLLFDYKNKISVEYENKDDLALQNAVRVFANSHWIEQQSYGDYIPTPDGLNRKEKLEYLTHVSDEYYAFERSKYNFDEIINEQSPVFYLNIDEYKESFDEIYDYIGDNLSQFSYKIRNIWQDLKLANPEKIKNAYYAQKRIYDMSCEYFEESIEDPYLQLLLSVRTEYNKKTKKNADKLYELYYSRFRVRKKLKTFFLNKYDEAIEQIDYFFWEHKILKKIVILTLLLLILILPTCLFLVGFYYFGKN